MPTNLVRTPEVLADFRGFQGALRLWLRDLERTLEYVEPVDHHDAVYSHRIYELLLRAATEFESVAKVYAHHAQVALPSRPVITDYRRVLAPLRLAEFEVGMAFWQPRARYLAPFLPWSGNGALPWYTAYNTVKHSRRDRFSQAALRHALDAGCAVFLTLNVGFGVDLWPHKSQQVGTPPPKTVDLQFEDVPITLRAPWGMV